MFGDFLIIVGISGLVFCPLFVFFSDFYFESVFNNLEHLVP